MNLVKSSIPSVSYYRDCVGDVNSSKHIAISAQLHIGPGNARRRTASAGNIHFLQGLACVWWVLYGKKEKRA
jgi:hypothetical protein